LVGLRDSLQKVTELLNYETDKADSVKIKIVEVFIEKSETSRKLIVKKLEALFNEALSFSQAKLRVNSKLKTGSGTFYTFFTVSHRICYQFPHI
jgi:hypothetical protein